MIAEELQQVELTVEQVKKIRALIQRGLSRAYVASFLGIDKKLISLELYRKVVAERRAAVLDNFYRRAFGSDPDGRLTLWWMENIERISAPAKKQKLKIDTTTTDASGKTLRALSDEELWKLLEQEKSANA
jgi:hypothetical protein